MIYVALPESPPTLATLIQQERYVSSFPTSNSWLLRWCQVNGYPADKLDEALDGVKVVVIPAGVPRKVLLRLFVRHAQ